MQKHKNGNGRKFGAARVFAGNRITFAISFYIYGERWVARSILLYLVYRQAGRVTL